LIRAAGGDPLAVGADRKAAYQSLVAVGPAEFIEDERPGSRPGRDRKDLRGALAAGRNALPVGRKRDLVKRAKRWLNRAHGSGVDILGVGVRDGDLAVTRPGRQQFAIRAESDAVDMAVELSKITQRLAVFRIPHAGGLVVTARRDAFAVRGYCNSGHRR